VKVDTLIYDLSKVRYILLCSDGLTSMLSDEEMHSIIKAQEGKLEQMVDRLIEAANEKGGVDNIAVVIAKKQEVNRAC